MHYFGYIFILIMFSIITLKQVTDAKRTLNDEDRDELYKQIRMLLRNGSNQYLERRTECPKPYHVLMSDGRCVWSCSQGTTPDNDSNECICQKGYYEIGHDQFGRRVCGDCVGPYHLMTRDDRCVWNCGQGTTPDNYGTECICERGYVQTGTDSFGRRICSSA